MTRFASRLRLSTTRSALRNLVALVVLLAALCAPIACAGRPPAPTTAAAGAPAERAAVPLPRGCPSLRLDGTVGAPLAEPVPAPSGEGLHLLVGYEVVLPGELSEFLGCYCAATALPVRRDGAGLLRLGPLLSAFEAAWLAHGTSGARVEQVPRLEPLVPAPSSGEVLARFAAPSDAGLAVDTTPADVMVTEAAQLVLGRVEVRRLRWRYTNGAEQLVDYRVDRGAWSLLYAHPAFDDPYLESFGVVLLDQPGFAPTFLRVAEAARGTGTKEERVCILSGAAAPDCRFSAFSASVTPGGLVEIEAMRFAATGEWSHWTSYGVRAESIGGEGTLGVGARWREGRPAERGAAESYRFVAGGFRAGEMIPLCSFVPGASCGPEGPAD